MPGSAATCRQHLRRLGSAGERDRGAPPAPPVPRTLCPFCNTPFSPPNCCCWSRADSPSACPSSKFPLGKERVVPTLTPAPDAPHRSPGRAPGNGPGSRTPGERRTPRRPISLGSGSTSATWRSSSSGGRSPRTPRPAAGRSRAQPSSALLVPPGLTVPPQIRAVNFDSFAFVSGKTPPCHYATFDCKQQARI